MPSSRAIPSLSSTYQSKFSIGAAVNTHTIKSHAALLTHHFNSVTAENEMKFERIHPEPSRYDFGAADAIVDFASSNGMKVRGHTLVWHNQTPSWVFTSSDGEPTSRTQLIALLQSHIDTVVSRYKGRIYAWDVVNEAVSDSDQQDLRDSPWLRHMGQDYMDLAFQMAHTADPDAKLFYNEYNETNPNKRERIYRTVKGMLERGVPVHGIGMQGHWRLDQPPLDEIRVAIERYASLGVELQVTELDVSIFPWDDRSTDRQMVSSADLERQARRYEDLFTLFQSYRHVLSSVTTWGIADDQTWLDHFPVRGRKDWPLLFSEQHDPKPALWRIIECARTKET